MTRSATQLSAAAFSGGKPFLRTLPRIQTTSAAIEQWIGEDGEFNEETTTTYNLWSTVLGAMIAELDDEGDPTTCFVYASSRIAKLHITPSSSSVKFEFNNPQTQTLYIADHTGKGARSKEYDPLGADVPKFDPFLSQKRLYTDLKDPGKLFREGSDPFRYDSNCQLDGMPISCSLRQQLISSGSVMMQVGVGMTAERIPIDSYALGIYREWVPTGAPKKRVPRLKKPNDDDVIVTNTNEQNGEYVYKFFDVVQNAPQIALKNATPDQQARFNDALNDVWNRLGANNGQNPCSKLFGGMDKVVKALKRTAFQAQKVDDGAAEYIPKKKEINIDPNEAFMATSMRAKNRYGFNDLTIMINTGSLKKPSVVQFTNPTSLVQAASFILAHELGHAMKLYGKNDNDGGGYVVEQGLNNEMIRKACFSELEVQDVNLR